MPPDMTACTIDSGARLSAPTCSSQATTATIQPIANHRERNRPAALPSGCCTRIGGASTGPSVLEQEGDVGGQGRDECEKQSEDHESRAAETPVDGSGHSRPVAGSFPDSAAPHHGSSRSTRRPSDGQSFSCPDRQRARRSRRVHVAEVEEPDAARQICVAARVATVKPSTGRSAAARCERGTRRWNGSNPAQCGACGTLRCVRRGPPADPGGVHRRCDRAWVSRACAASHIRPSSRSRVGLVGLEL